MGGRPTGRCRGEELVEELGVNRRVFELDGIRDSDPLVDLLPGLIFCAGELDPVAVLPDREGGKE